MFKPNELFRSQKRDECGSKCCKDFIYVDITSTNFPPRIKKSSLIASGEFQIIVIIYRPGYKNMIFQFLSFLLITLKFLAVFSESRLENLEFNTFLLETPRCG